MNETKVCVCQGDRRKDGFTSIEVGDALWWVCAGCRLPTRAWLDAMRARETGRTSRAK